MEKQQELLLKGLLGQAADLETIQDFEEFVVMMERPETR